MRGCTGGVVITKRVKGDSIGVPKVGQLRPTIMQCSGDIKLKPDDAPVVGETNAQIGIISVCGIGKVGSKIFAVTDKATGIKMLASTLTPFIRPPGPTNAAIALLAGPAMYG